MQRNDQGNPLPTSPCKQGEGESTTIRRATAEDAAALAELGTATFIESFGQLYVPRDLQAFLEESHSVEAYAKVLANPHYALWIAIRDGRTNGELHAALEDYDKVNRELYDYLLEQNANK